jgi:hypothetical protein
MKKLLVLMLVLGMASSANALVIDLVTNPQFNYQDGGAGTVQYYGSDSTHAGTVGDPIGLGETMHLEIILKWVPDSFPYSGYPSYDGYVLSAMDLTLSITSGTGELWVNRSKKNKAVWGEHADWTFTGGPTIDGGMSGQALDTGPYASSASTIGNQTGIHADGQDEILIWNLYVKADAAAGDDIVLTWGLNAPPGSYYDYTGDGIVAEPTITALMLGDLGNLTIYVPEPMTVMLLGLGGLFLRRRKR